MPGRTVVVLLLDPTQVTNCIPPISMTSTRIMYMSLRSLLELVGAGAVTAVSGLMPSGVSSWAQAAMTVGMKPMIIRTMTNETVQSGICRAGSTVSATWINSHAATA